MVMQGEFEFEASFRLHSKFQAATLGSQNLIFKKKKKSPSTQNIISRPSAMSQCDSRSHSDTVSHNVSSIIYEAEVKGFLKPDMMVNIYDPSTQ